jgi:hypothetical protein
MRQFTTSARSLAMPRIVEFVVCFALGALFLYGCFYAAGAV